MSTIPNTLILVMLPILLALPAAAPPAAAQPPAPDGAAQWSFGSAVIFSPAPYVGAVDRTIVVPALGVRWKRFYLQGITAGYRLHDENGFFTDVIARVRFMGYDAEDSDLLAGMEDRDTSLDAGVSTGWRSRRFSIRLEALSDVLGESGGQELALLFELPQRISRHLIVTPSVGFAWQSGDLADHYYGVRPAEARPDRPAYALPDAVNGRFGISFFVPPTRHWFLRVSANLELLDNSVTASPIVEDDVAWGGYAVVGYAF